MDSVENPLVSILIITYNSSDYVIKTLESTKSQSYRNLELIISDDFSTDDTVEKIRKWLSLNNHYFTRTKLVEAFKNTGIPGNVNRGIKVSNGVWIKIIAGDDILLNNCVSDNVNFVSRNKDVNFLFSRPIYIDDSDNLITAKDSKIYYKNDPFYKLDARSQFLHLLTKDHPINPPTLFYKKQSVEVLGGFDEKFRNEDFPLYLKVTHAGEKLYFMDEETVKYRIHDSSFSQKIKSASGISSWNYNKLSLNILPYVKSNLIYKNPLTVLDIYNKLFFYNVVKFFGNTKKLKNRLSFIRWFSPLVIKNKINKIL